MYLKKVRRARPEQQIQKAVFAHLHARGAPGIFAFHCPNGGFRKPIEAKIFKSLGVRAGLPDVIVIHEGRVFALELKAPGRRASATQTAVLAAMEAAGAIARVARGLDEAIAALEGWGLLRGRAA